VASGIFILVILLGVGKGLQNGIEKQFERDADGIIELWSGVTTIEYKGLNPGREIQFRNSDYDISIIKFENQLDKRSASYNNWNGSVVYKKETGSYQYRGVTPDYQAIENATVVQGRFVNQNDLASNEKVVVIGQKIKNDLFKDNNPIGEAIALNNINFKVIGVFTDPAGEREETRLYLPLTTAQKVFGAGDKISNLFYTLKKKATYEEALAESTKFSKEHY
jgi:putative ABC transport system permease protein